MEKIKIFNCFMNVSSIDDTVIEIEKNLKQNLFIQHGVVNVAKLINMRSDFSLFKSISSCNMINIDGMGVVWAARFLGYKIPERVSGIDLFYRLLGLSVKQNYPIFLLGAKAEILDSTVKELQKVYPGIIIAGYHHGYFWDDERSVVELIRRSGSKMLFVAITSPAKENFIDKWRNELGVDLVMGVGGSFDVIAGSVSRAPKWMQNAGLEWLYRLIQEPRRMWKRYLITNSKFIFLLFKEWIDMKKRIVFKRKPHT